MSVIAVLVLAAILTIGVVIRRCTTPAAVKAANSVVAVLRVSPGPLSIKELVLATRFSEEAVRRALWNLQSQNRIIGVLVSGTWRFGFPRGDLSKHQAA